MVSSLSSSLLLPLPLFTLILHLPQRLVERWGPDIEAQLDRRDAVKYLTQCQGISGAKAAKIKAAWDATKGGWEES